ncbi:MAG: 4Fe-4S dicluster domain-containing protein, partial [Candidatus Heimdallarchaeota archaeon]|nr:4Fe-4S dicluster domain-containing protein [Candidatus Heimdallarchaeota archaeon]
MRSLPIIKIDKTCIKCNKCVDVCPRYIFFPSENEIKLRDLETCNDCGHCIAICPVDAIYHNRLIKDSV